MPRNVAPIQLSLPGGMAENRLPFVIVMPGGSIQLAIDTVSPLGPFPGKHIWIWPGTWTLFASLNIPANAEIYIWGCGHDTIIEMDAGGGGPTPMFALAAGVNSFELHDLTIEQNGFATDIVGTAGQCNYMHYEGILSNPIGGPVNLTNFILQTAAGDIGVCKIEDCDIDGVLDLRTAIGNLYNSQLDAVDGGHNFQVSAVIYAARNRYLGGIGAPTVTTGGAGALFHDEGSHYTGDTAFVMTDGEANLRGCHVYAGTGITISQANGTLLISDCWIRNNNNATLVFSNGDVLGVHNCDMEGLAGGSQWGVQVEGGHAEIVGNHMHDCGITTDVVATISANMIDTVVVQVAIRVRANDVTITGNKIVQCGHVGLIGIELDDNDDNVVVGNQLQGYTVNENVGAVGNIIAHNRVGA